MKRLIEFIKTTAIGGLVVIVPMAILIIVIAEDNRMYFPNEDQIWVLGLRARLTF